MRLIEKLFMHSYITLKQQSLDKISVFWPFFAKRSIFKAVEVDRETAIGKFGYRRLVVTRLAKFTAIGHFCHSVPETDLSSDLSWVTRRQQSGKNQL
jgi:hypothetical protein